MPRCNFAWFCPCVIGWFWPTLYFLCADRVLKINSHKEVAWRYVPTADNPADLASRGGHVEEADPWWHGPRWLGSPELWPADVLNEPSEESQTEAKPVQKVLGVAVNEENEVEEVLHKFHLQKASRICAWMRRFNHNSLRSRGTSRILGPLTTEETNSQRLFWEKQAQKNCDIERDRVALNLQPNQDGILGCRGRIQGSIQFTYQKLACLVSDWQRTHTKKHCTLKWG